ncbi:MAG TPA: M15 family metallopeptidase [Allosphingosinicella sp.]|jgi:hypothetical protein
MAETQSFRGRTFRIDDPDARLRQPNALHKFLTRADGAPARIANGTKVKVAEVKAEPAGGTAVTLFARVIDAATGAKIGWTSGNNLQGKLLSETLGSLAPPRGAHRQGPHAAWSDGKYLGQVTLVKVAGTANELAFISKKTCGAFLALVAAARKDGVTVGLNSGFRSWPEQKHLYDGFKRGLPGFNPANPPGYSNHQNGVAFDFSVGGGGTNPVYLWLQAHATRFGFLRTVSREAWHWECRPTEAAEARARGSFTAWG